MDVMFYLFFGTVAGMMTLASIAIWSPRRVWIRTVALAIGLGMLPLGYMSLAQLLSKPKPKQLAWFERNVARAHILGISFAEGKAIYLWMRLPGSIEPRYYSFPWSQKIAESLQDEMEAASKQNGKLMVIKPFANEIFEQQGGLNTKIVPPPVLPMKPPRIPGEAYNPRSTDI
ncbi:MAG: hypothetical protein ACR2PG_23915 [Hyphomicrobiaceae bacterium]